MKGARNVKIEMCEQMVQSWLYNCELCEIVQTNWTVSPLRPIDSAVIKDVEKMMKEIQDKLNETLSEEVKTLLQSAVDEDYAAANPDEPPKKTVRKVKSLNIFKKNKGEQFIRQCEIDVVGAKFADGVAERIYLVDSAFHKTGLGYHDVVATVAKKIIRAALVAVIVFGENVPITVGFAAPNCRPAVEADITKVVNILSTILGPAYSNITIELYFNERFATDIYLPLMTNLNALNNDNDLFMRGMNLSALADDFLKKAGVTITPATKTKTTGKTTASAAGTTAKAPRGANEKLVKGILKDILAKGKMTPALLNDLQIPAFAKNTFKLSTYPLLVEEAYFPKTGYEDCRYYKKPLAIAGGKYRVCSQWYPDRLALLEAWHKSL